MNLELNAIMLMVTYDLTQLKIYALFICVDEECIYYSGTFQNGLDLREERPDVEHSPWCRWW